MWALSQADSVDRAEDVNIKIELVTEIASRLSETSELRVWS
jgi:hypothetical protein